jgi:hypothetical protein
MSHPPILTNRCCKLVSDRFPIRARGANLSANRLN